MNAALSCKWNTQRTLTLRDLNWVQHWVSRIGPLAMYMTKTENAMKYIKTDWMVFHRVEECSSLPTHREWRCAKIIIIIFQFPGVVCVRMFLCFHCSWQCKMISIYYGITKRNSVTVSLSYIHAYSLRKILHKVHKGFSVTIKVYQLGIMVVYVTIVCLE